MVINYHSDVLLGILWRLTAQLMIDYANQTKNFNGGHLPRAHEDAYLVKNKSWEAIGSGHS